MDTIFTLLGKTVLVTGASSGIGEATAIVCSKLGANVIASGRNEDRLKSLMGVLDNSMGQHHQMIAADLSTQDGIQFLVSSIPEIDGLSDNAGKTNGNKLLKFINHEEVLDVLNVNTVAHVLLLSLLFKKKKLKKNSSVVITASIGGNYSHVTGQAAYGMSKAAIQSLTAYCAVEYSVRGIRCNSVCPGMIKTPLIQYETMTDDERIADAEKYLLKRYGEPTEVANAIAFLLSDAASYITGSSLVIDGGYSVNH